MARAAALAAVAVVVLAGSARAQCLGDFNGDFKVEINEIVISVNNALNDCAGYPTPTPTPLGGTCPINFFDNNTQNGTPDCFYAGTWNPTCGANDLAARWISDGAIVIVQLLGLQSDVFLAADVRSSDAGELFGWFTKTDLSDLQALSGPMLHDSGRTLVIAPCTAPFQIEMCDVARYEGTFTQVINPPAGLRAGIAARIDPTAFQRLRAQRPAGDVRPNLQRR